MGCTVIPTLPPWPCINTSWLITPSGGDILPPPGKLLACSPNQQGKLQPPQPSPRQMEITYSCRGGGGGREQKPAVQSKEPGWNPEWLAGALTTFVLLDDIHHLPGLEAQLRVLLLLIVGHHHILFQDHGLGAGVGTWRRQKARGEPAASHGPAAGAPPVHRPRGRLLCRQRRSEGLPAARVRSSLGPKDRPYSKAPHRPAAPRGPGDMGSQGTEGGWREEKDRQRQRWRPSKLRGKDCCCDELVTAQHEGGKAEARGGRGLSRPFSGWGVRGGPQAGGWAAHEG